MPFDIDRLRTILLNSGIQKSNPVLFQVVNQLITSTRELEILTGIQIEQINQLQGDFVVGPPTAANDAVATFNSTTGKLVQNTTTFVDQTGVLKINGLGGIAGGPSIIINDTSRLANQRQFRIDNKVGLFKIFPIDDSGISVNNGITIDRINNVSMTFLNAVSAILSGAGGPSITYINSSNPANQRRWSTFTDGTFFYLYVLDDSNSIQATAIKVDRTGVVLMTAGLGATPLNATFITSGTLPDARLTSNVVLENVANIFTNTNIFQNHTYFSYNSPFISFIDQTQAANQKVFHISNNTQLLLFQAFDDAQTTASGTVTMSRAGVLEAASGLGTTPLNATQITSGTLADNRLTSNVPLKNTANTFTAIQSGTAQPRASVSHAGSVSVATATFVTISFDTEVYDIGNCWAIGDPTKIYCPTGGDGMYLAVATYVMGSNTVGTRFGRISKNGTAFANIYFPANVGDVTLFQITALLPMVAGDYLQLLVYQTSGSTLSSSGCMMVFQKLW